MRDHPRELAALQQLAPLAATAGRRILPETDRHLRAAAGLDAQQVALARGRAEAEHGVLLRRELHEDDSLPRAGQVIDLIRPREHPLRLTRGHERALLSSSLL